MAELFNVWNSHMDRNMNIKQETREEIRQIYLSTVAVLEQNTKRALHSLRSIRQSTACEE